MWFADILDVHDSYFLTGSQNAILGDGFLMQTNPVYRNVKTFSLKLGCKYVEAYPEYLLLPFHELPKILESKRIPFVPGARLMKDIEGRHPGVFNTDDVPVPESYHLHESAHVIAEHLLKDVKLVTQEEQILKFLLAESFANTVDALVWLFVDDNIHGFFLKQNSYMHPQKKVIQAIQRLHTGLGFSFTFRLLFFTYVHANFLRNTIPKKFVQDLIRQYAATSKVNTKLQQDIEIICAVGEKLDPRFRMVTTGNYFKQQGFHKDIFELLNFPFMKVCAARIEFHDAIHAMCDCVHGEALAATVESPGAANKLE